MFNIVQIVFPEFFEDTRSRFKVMPILSQHLQTVPSEKVGLWDHTGKPLAKRVDKVGRV